MKFSIIILSLCLFLSLRGEAQVYFGAQMSPGDLIGGGENKNKKSSEDAFADSFILEFSSTSLYGVFKSTHPKKEIKRYMREGFYRQEMLMLFFMAAESSSTLKTLAADIKLGKTLRYVAVKNKIDFVNIFRKSREIKKEIESKMEEIKKREVESGERKKAKEKQQDNGEKKEKKEKKIKK